MSRVLALRAGPVVSCTLDRERHVSARQADFAAPLTVTDVAQQVFFAIHHKPSCLRSGPV
jgi:hypothetical protein